MSDNADNHGFLMRLQDVMRSGSRGVDQARSGLAERVKETLDRTIAPAVEAKARQMLLKLAEPDNAQKLQQTLASLAQFAMRSGFRSDPNARLLFDFVDALEQDHSREEVLQIVIHHAVDYEHDLLATLLRNIQGGGESATVGAERLEQFRQRASSKLLSLLCALVSLETQEPVPDDRQAQIAYFESSPIDARFKVLARMAIGDEAVLAVGEASHDKQRRNSGDLGSKKTGLLGRLVGRFTADEPTALTQFVPSLSDPALRFLTTSHLFFMQSYLVRAMIEGLPEALGAVRDFERQGLRAGEDDADDVIELGD